jgi:hypothetical protein
MANEGDIEHTLVGERQFYSNNALVCSVKVYAPKRDESGYYRCDYEFVGQHSEYSGFAAGLDAIEALDNALWMVGTKLTGINEAVYDGKLRWEGAEPNRPIGLPVIRSDKLPFKDY